MEMECRNCKHYLKSDGYCLNCVASNVTEKTWSPSNWEATTDDNSVDHPAHYNQGKYECIEVMREVFGDLAVKNFCHLNAFKYVWRANEKNGIEDIKKARFYLDKMVEMEGGK